MPVDFSLSGKVALVTGAAQGIGRAIILLFAEKGADLALLDLKKEVEQVAKEVENFGCRALPIVADLTDFHHLPQVVSKVLEVFGTIDVLVNNAGISFLDDAENLPEEYWDKTLAVNLKAPFLLSQLGGER